MRDSISHSQKEHIVCERKEILYGSLYDPPPEYNDVVSNAELPGMPVVRSIRPNACAPMTQRI